MPTVELSMIVKDGGGDLGRCLKSVAPFVDRMVVGDTGSSDDSREIAREIGAEVLDVPWRRTLRRLATGYSTTANAIGSWFSMPMK